MKEATSQTLADDSLPPSCGREYTYQEGDNARAEKCRGFYIPTFALSAVSPI